MALNLIDEDIFEQFVAFLSSDVTNDGIVVILFLELMELLELISRQNVVH
jgi:hypothetical protein